MNKNSRPNIVFIQNDHQTYYRWGCDGGVKPLRPNFEALAAEGVSFARAYCATPLCGPTRRTLLTGLFAHGHQNVYNYSTHPYDKEVYLDTLAQAGYKNYYYGKWHAGIGDASDHGCEGFSTTDYGNPYTKPEYLDFLRRKNLPQAVHRIDGVFPVQDIIEQGDWVGLEPGADYQCKDYWCGEHAFGVTTTPKETHESFFLSSLACEKLEELAQEGSDQPFMLRVDFWGPHPPYFPTKEFLDMYPEDQFDLPEYGSLHDDLKNKPSTYMRERSYPFGEDNILKQPSVWNWDKWKEVVRYNYAHISMIDAAGGQIINKLKELGLDDNTLIIWTSDHGDGIASHGGHFDKGSFLSEEVMRIPLAIKWPGVTTAGLVSDAFVSTVDMPVTMLDAAGESFTKNAVHGRSLKPILGGDTSNWRDDLMAETFGHGYGSEVDVRMVVWGDWKFVHTMGDISELYNLKSDPYELKNLAQDESAQAYVQQGRQRLLKWMTETEDTMLDTFAGVLGSK